MKLNLIRFNVFVPMLLFLLLFYSFTNDKEQAMTQASNIVPLQSTIVTHHKAVVETTTTIIARMIVQL